MSAATDMIESIGSRLKHPFLGTFTVAFVAHNWKCWLWAFTGTVTPQERVDKITELLEAGPWFLFGLGFLLLPFLWASFFVLVYPHVARELDKYNHRIKVDGDNQLDRITESGRVETRTFLNRLSSISLASEEKLNNVIKRIREISSSTPAMSPIANELEKIKNGVTQINDLIHDRFINEKQTATKKMIENSATF